MTGEPLLERGARRAIAQRRLLDLSRDALTTLEETGVNVLYLAIGQLTWFEPSLPNTPHHAPLVLVPVQLARRSASDRFQLRAREEDVEEVFAILKATGGLDQLHLAFYQDGDLESDKVWDVWRVEGPSFVWHFRGAPHVHAYINVGIVAAS